MLQTALAKTAYPAAPLPSPEENPEFIWVEDGIYKRTNGKYYERALINGRRTRKSLKTFEQEVAEGTEGEFGGRWTVDGGRWTVDGGRWAVGSGQWALFHVHGAVSALRNAGTECNLD